jgi:hypothetical protein
MINYLTALPDTTEVALIALCGVVLSAFVAWLSAFRASI